tara:strand:- start:108 stop:278 length:171 start_codon:yes stop_codon:yes gene_type:complete
MNDTFTNEGAPLHNVKESALDFLKPDPECDMCDMVDNYVCFFCEDYQVQTSKDKLL